MKVTFVLHHAGLAGGVRVVAIYAELLKQRGHEITVISTPFRFKSRREQFVRAMRQFRRKLMGHPPPSHFTGVDVKHTIIRHDPPIVDADVPDADVVIATWWESAEWVANLSTRKGAKAYFVQHFEVHPGQPANRVRATWTLPLKKIAVARWLADIGRYEFGDSEVVVVPNAVDVEQFYAAPRRKQPMPTMGMMFATKHYKGCDICLEAFDRARREVPALRLRVFGSPPLPDPSPLPADTEYVMRPAQDQLREVYASCDAWLFGSRTEGFGLPILEAMACRTPVIATPVGAAPDLIGEGGGGVLVKAEDPADMARAIVEMVALPEAQWIAMSQRAHEIATGYSWDDAADRFEAALERIAHHETERAAGTLLMSGSEIILWLLSACLALAVCVVIIPPLIVKMHGQYVLRRACQGRLVLSYDDVPGAHATPRLLEVLAQLHVRATFYLVGFRAAGAPDVCDQLAATHHDLGTHTNLHRHPWKQWPWTAVRDVHAGYEVMEKWIETDAPFRPPFGKLTTWTWLASLRRGVRLAWWTLDSGDSRPTLPDPDTIVKHMLDAGGAVVLLHCRDRGEPHESYTLDITERLIAAAREHGYTICTFSDLFSSHAAGGSG